MRNLIINTLHTAADRLSGKEYQLRLDGFTILAFVIGHLSHWLGVAGDRLWVQQRVSLNNRLYAEAQAINQWSALKVQLPLCLAGLGLALLAYGVFDIVGVL